MTLSHRLERLAEGATAGPWDARVHIMSPAHGLHRLKLSVQHGPLGSFDKDDARLIVELRNALPTIIAALKEQGK